jgi:cell division protein FtsQ
MDRGGRFVRPVSQERKPSKPRGQSGRTPSRGITRGSAPQPRGRRSASRPSFASRFSGFLRSPMTALTLAVLLITAVAAFFASGVVPRTVQKTDSAFVSGTGFAVGQVHLSGNTRTSAAAIVGALGFKPGQPIFGVNLREARARLLQLPWVANAEVKRRYPDDIVVNVVERVPFARWQSPGGLFVVERNGRPITAEGADTFTRLPLLAGGDAPQNAAQLVELVSRHHAIASQVAAYQYQSERRWNLLLNGGGVVKLPETGWQHQLDVLDRLISGKGVLESDIREIDLRSATHYFFVRRNSVPDKDKKTETGSSI